MTAAELMTTCERKYKEYFEKYKDAKLSQSKVKFCKTLCVMYMCYPLSVKEDVRCYIQNIDANHMSTVILILNAKGCFNT